MSAATPDDDLGSGDDAEPVALLRTGAGGLYGRHTDGDNAIAPSDHVRRYMSTVLRGQVYITDTVHWLTETSIAKEISDNGNAYREHYDSLFANTEGRADARGLEYGDTDTRYTWQGKAGVVNPYFGGKMLKCGAVIDSLRVRPVLKEHKHE